MRKYIRKNTMSARKQKKVEKMAIKIMRFMQKNGVVFSTISFMSKQIKKGEHDYLNINITDKSFNQLLDVTLWED